MPLFDYKRLAIEVARQIAPDLQETLEHTLQTSLGRKQNELQAHTSRLEELEQRVLLLESDNDTLNTKIKSKEEKVGKMGDRLEDLENCSHCNNLRMVGLPKSIKHSDLHNICEADLPQALGLTHKCRIDRAHRIDPDLVGRNGSAAPTRQQSR